MARIKPSNDNRPPIDRRRAKAYFVRYARTEETLQARSRIYAEAVGEHHPQPPKLSPKERTPS